MADPEAPVFEFYAPFAHVAGRYEWCRVRSPTHGLFDLFILLGASTSVPADVWVGDAKGRAFMEERYAECRTHAADELRLDERDQGLTVIGLLRSSEGPVREAAMRFEAPAGVPEQVPYGGEGKPVWGSRLTCTGVDLNLAARVHGRVVRSDGSVEALQGAAGIVTLGSYGRIAPRKTLTL